MVLHGVVLRVVACSRVCCSFLYSNLFCLCFGAKKELRIDLAMLWDDPFGEQEDELAGELDEQNEDGEVPSVHWPRLSILFRPLLISSFPTPQLFFANKGTLLRRTHAHFFHMLTILLFSRLHHLFDRLPKVHVRAE